jgi:hypothetical protein
MERHEEVDILDRRKRVQISQNVTRKRIRGFEDQKWWEKNAYVLHKNGNIFFPRPSHEEHQSYRKSLRPSKENIQHLKRQYTFIN